MQLTDAEKLIIHLLCEIHQKLGVEYGIDAAFVQDALYHGHAWAVKRTMPGVFDSPETPPAVVSEVGDMLEIWDMIELSYERLDAEDKALVAKEAAPFASRIKFTGFEGNGEATHMSVASYLVNKVGLFATFKGRDLNAFMPSVENYRRMLRVYKPIQDEDYHDLTASELIQMGATRLAATVA